MIWILGIPILIVVTILLLMNGLRSTSWFITLPVGAAWIVFVHVLVRFMVRPYVTGIRLRGALAVWLATGIMTYIVWVALGGHDFRGAALIVWPAGLYVIGTIFTEASRR